MKACPFTEGLAEAIDKVHVCKEIDSYMNRQTNRQIGQTDR